MSRTILHADLDAFYAAVEMRDDPALRGRPVLVGGSGGRGVVCAASYPARRFGCRSAMPMAQAVRLCPEAVVVKPRFEAYRAASDAVFAILERCTPLVEPLSIDEAFLDVTGSKRLLGDGVAIAERIRAAVRDEVGLTCSVGVAPNKFLAKLASDLRKPDALVAIDQPWIRDVLPTLAVSRLWGVGPVLESKLLQCGIRTFGDVAAAPTALLARCAGSDAEHLQALARGEDERPVTVDRVARSIGQERTFGVDCAEPEALKETLLGEVESIARRLRRAGLRARTIAVKLRFGDFTTITRSATRDEPTDRTDLFWHEAERLFDEWARHGLVPLRLIGATLSQLGEGNAQEALFTQRENERRRALDRVADRIVERFGNEAARRRNA